MLSAALACAGAAQAQEVAPGPPADSLEREESPPSRQRLFPIGADKAIARGHSVPLPFGAGFLLIDNQQKVSASNLAAAIGKGDAPAGDEPLTDLPFVIVKPTRGHTTSTQFKADLWILPALNLFVGIGKAKGDLDVDVEIDLDALFPPPICRPRDPCGALPLSFDAEVDNTTVTLGMLLAYGQSDWFMIATAAHTLSISSKERSNLKSSNFGLRMGPRLKLGGRTNFTPYAGVNYFNLDTTVQGVVRAPGAFPDGDDFVLEYRADIENPDKLSAVLGFNLGLARHWELQAEHDIGSDGHRDVVSLTYRF